MTDFDFGVAFSRNLGWLTEQEQAVLRGKRVAIAGLGGVGGVHLMTLTRLGVGAFTVSDADIFELANFNRQAGASLSHVGQRKADVMAAMARDVNPELDLRLLPEGVTEANLGDFLRDADLYLDGLDFFALDIRRRVFARCAELGIPAVTAAPIGMGSALLAFLPGKMTFEDYFRFKDGEPEENLLKFLIGLSPRMLHVPYLVDDTRADFRAQRVPSTPVGCELSAGLAASHVVKILLQRGDVPAAPRGVHFDGYRNRLVHTWRPWGNANPLQKIMLAVARKKMLAPKPSPATDSTTPPAATPVERVLDLARWAPSGDNLQQWRFETLGPDRFRVYGDNHSRDVYFLTPWPKLLALGGLLETIAVAATGEGRRAVFRRPEGSSDSDREIVFEVVLEPEASTTPSPLFPFIRLRTTQRRPMTKRPLAAAQKAELESAVAPFTVAWIDTPRRQRELARLASQYADIRLRIPEAFEVHKKVIEWDARYSTDRIPDQAIGLDVPTLKLMRWALSDWKRVAFLNKYLAGTWMPRFQLEWRPGLNAAGYVSLLSPEPLRSLDDFIAAGRAMQRFWLTITKLGLQFQPQMAPLIFDSYVREEIDFTEDRRSLMKAKALSPRLAAVLGEGNHAFLGRVGVGVAPRSRSLRKPLAQLLGK